MKTIIRTILFSACLLAAPLSSIVFAEESVGRFIDDVGITTRLKARFVEDPIVSALRINVATQEGVVQLSGFANSEEEKAHASSVAAGVAGVRDVRNDIIVKSRAVSSEPERSESRLGEPAGERSESAARDAARSGSSTGVYRY